jgi:threonine dehydrogenase-like Zn-dependent dehydrogenase
MLALRYFKSIPRYLMVRSLTPLWSDIGTSPLSCLKLVETPEPELPNADWVKIKPRLSGICGSDVAVIQSQGSTYFTPFSSTPFTFGHEVVGTIAEVGATVRGVKTGDRVILEPSLNCTARGISPVCRTCAAGNTGNCENVTCGCLAPGLLTGFCDTTGGAWSSAFVAHTSQLHPVPAALSDEEAVLVEPFCCALHAALKANLSQHQNILVLGCGVIGLLQIAALRLVGFAGQIFATARYPHQAKMAAQLGADLVLPTGAELYDKIVHLTHAKSYTPELSKPVLLGGVDCTFDCIASDRTLDDALRLTRSQGQVIVVGRPGIAKGIDWTTLWHQELEVIGAYTYGQETFRGETLSTFALALRLIAQSGGLLKPLVTGYFPLSDYRQALQVATAPSRHAAIKTVFDFR